MKARKRNIMAAAFAGLLSGSLLLTGFGFGGGSLDTYTNAYRSLMANRGFDADLEATFSIGEETKTATGNFKVDDSGDSTIFLLNVNVDGEDITQFSDGEYLYTEARGEKTKYKLGEKAEQESRREDPEPESGPEKAEGEKAAPEYDTSEFLKEFASCLEAGKIRELGLLSPIDGSVVTKTEIDGDTYNLTISDKAVAMMLNIMSQSINMGDDSVSVSEVKDFQYTAVVKDNFVTNVTYSGVLTVNIPASISGSGADETADMDMEIKVSFNNPGEQVSIEIPSTEGF